MSMFVDRYYTCNVFHVVHAMTSLRQNQLKSYLPTCLTCFYACCQLKSHGCNANVLGIKVSINIGVHQTRTHSGLFAVTFMGPNGPTKNIEGFVVAHAHLNRKAHYVA